MTSGEFGALVLQVDLKRIDKRLAQFPSDRLALLGMLAIDGALDVEQGVDAVHDLDRDRRQHDRFLAGCLTPGVLLEIGHGEERAPRVNPAPHFQNLPGTSIREIEVAVAIEGVGLEQSGISGQMAPRVFAFAIAGIVEHRCRRRRPAERLVVTDVHPTAPRIGLALGQDRDRRVIAVQAFGRHDVRLDEFQHRVERCAA